MKEVKEIMGEVYAALHRASLSISGYNVVDCLWEFGNAVTEADMKTRHGTQRYRITLQEA